jgi:hypothetical protein
VVHDSAWLRDGGAYAQSLPVDAIRLSTAEQQPGLTDQFGVIP